VSKTQALIGNALLTSLVDLKERSGGELNIEDVGALFEHIATSLPTDENILKNEMGKIAGYMALAKHEITSITHQTDNKRSIGHAGAELDEVIRTTEQAANEIMDAADQVMDKLSGVADKAVADAIGASIEQIYQACNFQDLTGQRVQKVMKTLEFIDFKINKLLDLINGSTGVIDTSLEEDERFKDTRPDAELLNGPQMSGAAPSQADIDALFGS
jgi:chemotaxis protein CheZ